MLRFDRRETMAETGTTPRAPIRLTWGGRFAIAIWVVLNGMLLILELVSR